MLELQYIFIISCCICAVTYGFLCGFLVCVVVMFCCSAILVSALECVTCVMDVWLFCVLLSGVGFG
jgi:hypothetical protein